MTKPVFLYGTLCDPELFEIVSGVTFKARPARLADASVHWVEGESFPILKNAPSATAEGLLVEPKEDARERLDFYEIGFGYRVEDRLVTSDGQQVRAAVYIPEADWPLGAPWSLEDWQLRHGALTRLAAMEYMRLFVTHQPEEAACAFPQVRSRAASRLRAADAPSPNALEPDMTHLEVVPERTAQPYTDYFAVREDWLAFPKFDGGQGPVVKRASFMSGDAVTVLPYDPKSGDVLIVRQFRHGPFCRGDSNPWTLEPAAGRIDPGESPDQAVRRELLEETGVVADALHFVGKYYPSPGAYSEFLFSYVAIADLEGVDGGVGGVEDEAEDIMRHVIPLDEALGMIETGAVNTGPLILSLQWLQMHRNQLV